MTTGAPKLSPRSSVGGGLLVSPNDLFAVAPDRFYVTNDHVTKTALGRFAEDYLLWPHADLLYFNGTSFRISVQRMAFPNGVYVSPDGSHLYVALSNERRLIAFSREPFFGNLTEIGSLSLPARPDNISADAQGRLIIAGRPSLLRDNQFRADPHQAVALGGLPRHISTSPACRKAMTRSSPMTAAGSAPPAPRRWSGKQLLIGSVLDNKLLDCTIQ